MKVQRMSGWCQICASFSSEHTAVSFFLYHGQLWMSMWITVYCRTETPQIRDGDARYIVLWYNNKSSEASLILYPFGRIIIADSPWGLWLVWVSSYGEGLKSNQKVVGVSHDVHATIAPGTVAFQAPRFKGGCDWWLLFSSGSVHSTSQHWKSSPVGMKHLISPCSLIHVGGPFRVLPSSSGE